MIQTFDWNRNRDMWIRVLRKQTGEDVDVWNRRIDEHDFASEGDLRAWLTQHGVTGYGRQLLVMERFGYPDFLRTPGSELVDRQYANRPNLRPIHDAVVEVCQSLGTIAIQARKGYTSLLTPRRTFARLQPATKTRLDLGLRLENAAIGDRLVPSRIHLTMPVQVGLQSMRDVDAQVRNWLKRAYGENC